MCTWSNWFTEITIEKLGEAGRIRDQNGQVKKERMAGTSVWRQLDFREYLYNKNNNVFVIHRLASIALCLLLVSFVSPCVFFLWSHCLFILPIGYSSCLFVLSPLLLASLCIFVSLCGSLCVLVSLCTAAQHPTKQRQNAKPIIKQGMRPICLRPYVAMSDDANMSRPYEAKRP